MELDDVVCEVRCQPRSACHGNDTGPAAVLESQKLCASGSCTPASAAVRETTFTDHLGLVNEDGETCAGPIFLLTRFLPMSTRAAASPPRTAIILPGAWAMGEGVLLETTDEPYGGGGMRTPACSAGSSGALQTGWSRMADAFTASIGSYLAGLASSIGSCSRTAAKTDDGLEYPSSPGEGRAAGSGSSTSPCDRRRSPPAAAALECPAVTPCASRARKKED